jgi:hypothetical protein
MAHNHTRFPATAFPSETVNVAAADADCIGAHQYFVGTDLRPRGILYRQLPGTVELKDFHAG